MKRVIVHIWRLTVFFILNHVLDGSNPHFFRIKRRLLRSIGFIIGENTSVLGPISCTGSLVVGDNCWIGANLVIRGNGKVVLGNNVDVGPDVTFLTGTHYLGGIERRAGKGYNCTIEVGNGCWIGARSTFLNEIQVGESTIIAAAACVNKSVPRNVLVGGVPARIIKELGDGAIQ